MRRTKIICTLGPATGTAERIGELIAAGANVFRLNMSHATHETVSDLVPLIRRIAAGQQTVVGVLLDTQGPAIRTGELPAAMELLPGEIFEFTVRGETGGAAKSVSVNYDGFVDDISEGDTVLVDNGLIHMQALEKKGGRLRCKVLTQGVLGSRRHINLPGVRVNLPALTEKDLRDVELGARLGVDLVALSFCREAKDVDLLRGVLGSHGSDARIVAKIEDQIAVAGVNAIIDKADAIMVARGDLGIECAMEDLPIIQRKIVKRCLRMGRPVIVATQMLESMIEKPVPTRAEVTDVANAAFEQADAIMLSGETAMGRYPAECVRVLDRIARRIERSGGAGYAADAVLEDDRQKTVHSAVVLANELHGAKLVVFTRSGYVAGCVSNLRPLFAPIHAFAPSVEVCRKLALNWGTQPHLLPFEADPGHTIRAAEEMLVARGFAKTGDRLVVISDMLAGGDRFDSIQLRVVK